MVMFTKTDDGVERVGKVHNDKSSGSGGRRARRVGTGSNYRLTKKYRPAWKIRNRGA